MASDIINLAKGNGDDHVYEAAVKILSEKLKSDYSFVIQTWNEDTPETKNPKILILTSDEMHQVPRQLSDKNVVHIFKQYAPMTNIRDRLSVINIENVTPIPLCHLDGVSSHNKPIEDRELDWCWMGQYDPYRRVDFRMAIDNLALSDEFKYISYWYEGWNNGVSKTEYSDILNNTKIVFAPTGSASSETFRFFEGLMCGCFVISVPQPKTAFYEDAPYLELPNWNNIIQYIRSLLYNKELMNNISTMSTTWYKKYCSPNGLAEYMFKALKNV